MTAGYYRFPTIHNETIIYVSEDDLWSVPAAGGVARRLTSNLGEVRYPRLSPDGKWLAFVGREEGAPEIYLMPAVGGSARRLTYLSSDCSVVGWTADSSHIIFGSTHGQIMPREHGLYKIAADTLNGEAEPLPYGPCRALSFGPQNQVILGRNVQDSARWKRYRGGTAGHLWLDSKGDGEFERLLADIEGNINAPMWITDTDGTDRLFFVSDHEGVSNLYSCTPVGMDLQRHTDHEEYYVRNPSTDGKQIVYHAGADIYRYDIAADSSQRVEIDYLSPRVQRNRKFVYAGSYIQDFCIHPSGLALAVTARGKAFAFHNHEGPVIQYGKRDGVRYRLPEWLNDGRRLLVISDESGEETLEIHSSDPDDETEILESLDIGRVIRLQISPTENKIALTNHRQELLVVDLDEKTLTLVERSEHNRIAGFDWSPDGRWLAYGSSLTSKTTAIRLYRLADPDAEDEALHEAETFTVTTPVLHDIRPAFDPDGKYLYFLSYRDFNPIYDNMNFDLTFPWGMRPFLITLRADLPNPFIPRPDWGDEEGQNGEEAEGEEDLEEEAEGEEEQDVEEEDAEGEDGIEDEEEEDEVDEDDGGLEEESSPGGQITTAVAEMSDSEQPDGETADEDQEDDEVSADATDDEGASSEEASPKEEAKPEPRNKSRRLQIDIEGIQQRLLPFPVQDGRYGQIKGISGKAYFTAHPLQGQLDGDYDAEDDDEPERGMLRVYNFKEYKVENMVDGVSGFDISRNRKKILYSSGHRLRVIPAGDKPPAGSGSPRRTGWIELSRVKISVDPQHEWEQMLREAWRLQRDQFWTEDMSQVDWQEVYQRYEPLVERVSTRSEFSDLMWEMQGELGTSHAYEMGGDYRYNPHYYSQGRLGATYHWDEEANGYRIDKLLLGDAWDERTHSPLAAPGIDVKVDDVIIAVNGQRVTEEISPAQLLVNLAGHEVLLTLAPRPPEPEEETGEGESAAEATEEQASVEEASSEAEDQPEASDDLSDEPQEGSEDSADQESGAESESDDAEQEEKSAPDNRAVVVQTMRSEAPIRYRDWVNHNRSAVHEATDGQIGYLHVPDMGARGYAEFHRGYLAEVDRGGLIVDVRYNGGGHVSQLLLEKLARRRLGYDLSRWGGMDSYPANAVAGPIVVLTNEHAGSDGDIFCHGFKMLKLGPLVGKRTWGGVVGIFPRHSLVDGTTTTQPEFSFWFNDVGWNIENYGTEPDIDIDIKPQDYAKGHDPQLDQAIEEALRLLKENPVVKPDLSERPNRARPKLPPRKSP